MTDDVEILLLDDDAPTARTVELRPRRRGRELALVVAAVSAVVGVGLIGDDGEPDATASPTTSSTRRATTATEDDTPSTTRRRVTRPPPSYTTTTTLDIWPQLQAGTGPLLPGADPELRLAVLHGNGIVTVAALDTGDRCRNLVSRNGAYLPWDVTLSVGGLLAQDERSTTVVDRDCARRELFDVRDSYPIATGPDRVWMGSGGNGELLVERALPSGELTGRTFDLPRFNPATAVVLGDQLVVGAAGEMTLVHPTTGARRSLGPGTPLASHGTRLAFLECPELHCRLTILDVASGARRTYDDVEPGAWDRSHFSDDGRLLRVPVAGRDEYQPSTAVVDVETSVVRVFDEPMMRTAFSPDDRWLFGVTASATVVAFDLVGDAGRVEVLPELRDVQGVVLL